MRVLVPIGTRPEIVKLAPVVRELRRRAGFEVRAVATGQHFDPGLTDVFYEQLGVRPDAAWRLEGDEGARVGRMVTLAWEEVRTADPSLVLLLGDTYTVPVFCLAARRHRVPVAHLEAGLRSFNPTSMEEVNRQTAAALAALNFAPTEMAAGFLRDEGVAEARIRVVGNPIVDVLRQAGVIARPPEERSGVVLTAHRSTNVDDPERLGELVELARGLAAELGPVTFPLHPRTAARLRTAGALEALRATDGLAVVDALPYDAMLELIASSRVCVTDSGGLQEEAAWLGVPVVVLRHSTPRWEGVEAGTSVLTGLDCDRALAAALRFATPDEQARVAAVPCPYGDGHTAGRVADALTDPAVEALLRIDEPALPAPMVAL